jgi:uncharacterized protein YbjT (DUF2867 family)
MKIILLGATGQIGSVIHDALKRTHEVVGTSRKPSPTLKQFDPFENNWSSLGTADVLINCVGRIEATSLNSFNRIHVELTQRIIEHRQVIGNPRIVQISALGASAKHQVEFLKTKGIADDLLLQHPRSTVVRPSIVCTHRTMIVNKMLMLSKIGRFCFGLLPLPEGFLQTRIQPIMPEDLVDLVRILCNDHEHRLVNAVGPYPISFRQILAILMQTKKVKFRLIEVPKKITDFFVSHVASRAIARLINLQQYQLLFSDNISDPEMVRQILGRPLTETKQFFTNEFKYASD